jgi:hypothetical protein
MTTTRPTVATAMRSLLEENAPTTGHLSPETLLAHQEGALASAAREAVREHLSDCPQCAERLLDLEAFTHPRETATEEAAMAFETDWRGVQQRLRLRTERSPPGGRSRGWGFWGGYALAATFLIATVGLAVRVAMLEHHLEAPRGFQSVHLDLARRGTAAPLTLRFGPGAENLALFLYLEEGPPPPPRYREYAVRLEQPEGTVVWTQEGLRAEANGPLRIFLPPAAAPPGPAVLRLFGREGEREEEIRSVAVEILHQP